MCAAHQFYRKICVHPTIFARKICVHHTIFLRQIRVHHTIIVRKSVCSTPSRVHPTMFARQICVHHTILVRTFSVHYTIFVRKICVHCKKTLPVLGQRSISAELFPRGTHLSLRNKLCTRCSTKHVLMTLTSCNISLEILYETLFLFFAFRQGGRTMCL